MILFTFTPGSPRNGSVEMTVGAATVVKLHTLFTANGSPCNRLFAAVVMVAVYLVLAFNGFVGLNEAVVPL